MAWFVGLYQIGVQFLLAASGGTKVGTGEYDALLHRLSGTRLSGSCWRIARGAARRMAPRRKSMGKPYRRRQVLLLAASATLAGAAAGQRAMAAGAPPDFSPTAQTAWVGIGIGALLPVPGSPKPVAQDPAHRYISNDESGVPGGQPTQRIRDISNPNLKQWAKDVMKKDNDEVLAGKFAFTARSSCKAAGVPGFDVLLGGALFIVQSPGRSR